MSTLMFILSEMIMNRLKELILDFYGDDTRDRKIYEICYQDVQNFLMYTWREAIEKNRQDMENAVYKIDYSSTGYELEDVHISKKTSFETYFLDYVTKQPEMVKEELDAFLSLWYSKYKQRTQIVCGQNARDIHDRTNIQIHRGEELISSSQVVFYKEAAIELLERLGEYACSNEIAEQLVKREIGKKGRRLETQEDAAKFTTHLLKCVRDTASSLGKLVFISIDGMNWNE